jgi:hypothetical protein
MYRWREEDDDAGDVSMGYFKDRHYGDVIERTAWALDDLDTDITKSFRLMTSDDRDIATTRNIPPDDAAVSEDGVSPDRCRVVIWNPERNVLVCCIGHKIYDYDPATNTYTLRNTLTAGRDAVRAFYTTETDSGGKNKRIVLVQCDINTYGTTSLRVLQAWCTTLDATGSGAYTVLDNERSMGTDVFPGTHLVREGEYANSIQSMGQILTNLSGENVFLQFRQRVDILNASAGTEFLSHQDDAAGRDDIWDSGANYTTPPQTKGRGWCAAYKNLGAVEPLGFRWAHGGQFACTLNIYTAGGRLYYFTWDSTNKYRLNYINLSTYAAGSVLALGGANTRVPYFTYSPQDSTHKRRMYVCQMSWDETGGTGNYSEGELYYYDHSAATWTKVTYLSGAGTSNAAWMAMEVAHHNDGIGVVCCAILYNRHTLKWRFCADVIGVGTWASTDSECQAGFLNGVKDQGDRLEGLFDNTNYADDKLFFVQAGSNLLWSFTDQMNEENLTAVTGGAPKPINTDRGLGSYFTATGVNYPDSDTPNGVMFWISANDYLDSGADHPDGRYVLCQYANFDPGFIELLDISGMSFWKLRSDIATAKGFVHFYAPDGTLVFKPRETSGAASFAFSKANKNYTNARMRSRGYEAVANVIIVQPWQYVSESRASTILKGYNETSKSGQLVDFILSGNPGENARWQIRFVTATTYDLYKLTGANADTATPKKAAQSIDSSLRDITDGAYLQFLPEHFEGHFIIEDTFTFTVATPQEALEQTDVLNRARDEDAPSIAEYHRRTYSLTDNRFLRPQVAIDHAANLLIWRKVRHEVVDLQVASDPGYQPLLLCTLADTRNGLDGTYQIMGIRYRPRKESTLMLVKV